MGLTALDDPRRVRELRKLISGKPCLRHFYADTYAVYGECLSRCPARGAALEIGSGAGFAKAAVPDLITSDVMVYEGLDLVLDARALPVREGALRLLCLLNAFHHIPDVERFLREAERCLMPGGRLLIVDQYPGWIGGFVLKRLHYEPFDPDRADWSFESAGPVSDANGALAWIVFWRDRGRFERAFPKLRIERLRLHSPLRYWLAGGLRPWSLVPGWACPAAGLLDRWLMRFSPELASFADIELQRVE